MSGAFELRAPTAQNSSWYQSAAPETSKVVVPAASMGRGRAGLLHWLAIHNKGGAKQYAFVFDGVDATGTLVAGPIAVNASDTSSLDCRFGIPFTTGLFIALSTTDSVFTLAGADAWFSAGYHVVT